MPYSRRMSPAPARTHAERRAATRAALLDATLESLTERGWAETSTRSIAERAGVTQGALQHHFPSKAALVEAALDHMMRELATASLAISKPEGTERERIEAFLDDLWAIHELPINRAMFELINAAHTDPDLGMRAAHILTTAAAVTQTVAEALLPTIAAAPEFRDWLLFAEATMRGTALATLPGAAGADWPTIRRHLLTSLTIEIASEPG